MSTKIRNSTAYDSATRQSTGKVVVKCGANWCGPCKQIAPAYELLAQKYPKVRFYTLDIDEVSDFEDAGVVRSVPSFLFFSGGNPAGMIIGADMRNVEMCVANLSV